MFLNAKHNHILDVFQRLFYCFPLSMATNQRRNISYDPAVFILRYVYVNIFIQHDVFNTA